MKMDLLQRARAFMAAAKLDAWLVSDFRGNNPVLTPILGRRPHLTRRVMLLVPAAGEPVLLVHAIEAGQFAQESEILQVYRTHDELVNILRPRLAGMNRVAIEYSPGGMLPAVSWVDAGTVDMLRSLGPKLESSADLLQVTMAIWDDNALAGHKEASVAVAAAKDVAFEAIRVAIASNTVLTEQDVQCLIGEQFTAGGLETDHPAIVGVNAHSSDPHYAPIAGASAQIHPGDWVLIDLWARKPEENQVFADITWVAVAASKPSSQQTKVFDIVRRARDLIVGRLHEAWDRGEALQGWQLDCLARDLIIGEGYEDCLLHRTGHSLSPGPAVHGLGANLDDVESRDTRSLLPGTGFTIEPGVYLDDFGVRLEIDVYLDPEDGPIVTTPVQHDIILLA
jgi:Xaa-Pro dipeptidase